MVGPRRGGKAGVSGSCVTFILTLVFALEELLEDLCASPCGFGDRFDSLLAVSLEKRHGRCVRH